MPGLGRKGMEAQTAHNLGDGMVCSLLLSRFIRVSGEQDTAGPTESYH